MKKFIRSLLLIILLSSFSLIVHAKSNPYPKMETSLFGGEIINCTWYAWQQAKDRMGVELPLWYNVETWYSKAEKAGYSVGQEPKVNSIMVWNYGEGFGGHVAYVTEVNGENVTYIEGGSPMTEDGINEDTMTLEMMDGFLVGFIYLDHVPTPVEENKEETKKEETVKEEEKPQVVSKSSNNNLSTLEISGLDFTFNKDVLEYNLEVENAIDKVTITSTSEDDKAVITGNDTYPLQEGSNKIVITVTAENGDVKDYTINIKRKEAEKPVVKEEKKEEPKKVVNKKPFVIGIIATLGVLVIVLVVYFIKRFKK